MKNNSDSNAVKAGIGYTIGNILIKGINFLSIPLFSRLLSTAEFGIYNVFISYETILFTIIGLAIHTSIKSAKLRFQERINDYTSSVSLIYFINLAIIIAVSLLWGDYIGSLLGFKRIYVFLLAFYAFSSAIIYLYNSRISLEYKYLNYLVVSFLTTVGNIVSSLLLIYFIFPNNKEFGRILGTTITVFFVAIGILYVIYKSATPRFKKEYWKFAVSYSLPIVPHSISQILLSQFDRIMIKNMVGDSEAGIYSMAGNLKLILTIIMESISTAWSTWFYEKMEFNNKYEIKKRATHLSILFTIFSVGLIAISPELILILGGAPYIKAKYVAIPMVLDALLLFFYNVIVQAEYYKNKTLYIMLGTIFVSILNIITNYIFIKQYGFIAAAYTTLLSYFCYLIVHIFISRKVIGFFVIPVKWILFLTIIAMVYSSVSLYFISNIFVRWGIGFATIFMLGLYLFYILKNEER